MFRNRSLLVGVARFLVFVAVISWGGLMADTWRDIGANFGYVAAAEVRTRAGIDVLEQQNFAPLRGKKHRADHESDGRRFRRAGAPLTCWRTPMV